MLLKFINRTGYIISLRNTNTRSLNELISDQKSRHYLPATDYNEFKCTKSYLVIKIVEEDAQRNVITAVILSIPTNGMEVLDAIIGHAVAGNVAVTGSPPNLLRIGEVMSVPKIEDDDFLVIGLGEYSLGNKLKSKEESVFLGLNKIITSDEKNDLATLTSIPNIRTFMGSEDPITKMDR